MKTNTSELVNVPELTIDISKLPPLLDCDGVHKHLAPIGRSLLYELATKGDITSASLGIGRGRRVFVTASIVQWLQKRAAQTKRPNIAPRRSQKARGPK